MPGPLTDVRVLDVTHVLNGPFCTMLLAHMGAEVIKIETGAGDRYRHGWAPPGVTRDIYNFIAVNSNKKSIRLNLKTEKGKEIFRELVKQSDVVTENFTVGVMDRLGLGYADLQELNPRIIYACSRGYGETGPYRHVRANAGTIASITGHAFEGMRMADKPGAKTVMELGDEAAGVSLCVGILAALHNRHVTGKGQKIEVSMQEALLGFMVSLLHHLFEGIEIATKAKECADGYYMFHVPDMTDDLWSKLMTALGQPDLVKDPRFVTQQQRRANYHEAEHVISDIVKSKTRQDLWKALSGVGLSTAPVLTLAEAVADPHLRERGAFVEVDHPDAGKVKVLAPWIRFSETPSAITSAAPAVGEHTHAVLHDLLGLSTDEIEALEKTGVIA